MRWSTCLSSRQNKHLNCAVTVINCIFLFFCKPCRSNTQWFYTLNLGRLLLFYSYSTKDKDWSACSHPYIVNLFVHGWVAIGYICLVTWEFISFSVVSHSKGAGLAQHSIVFYYLLFPECVKNSLAWNIWMFGVFTISE